jgi:serine/threonine-protein kinase
MAFGACGGESMGDGAGGGSGDSAGGAGGGTGVGAGGGGGALPPQGSFFPEGSPYDDDITGVTPVANSGAIVAQMLAMHPPNGWGSDGTMRMDASILVVEAEAGTPKRAHTPVDDFYWAPDCDTAPVPLPAGGASEGDWTTPPDLSGDFTGYDCEGFDDGSDCHILVFAPWEHRLYEIYHGTVRANGDFEAGCVAVWDTSIPLGDTGRGVQCTSADAAGYAIAPLLVTPEEVEAGVVPHAVRLVLPNDVIRGGVFYPPATHGTSSTGDEDTLPYGGRLRLRADYPIDDLPEAARPIARAMQTYGAMLADGGQIAITLANDTFSSVKWAELGLEMRDLGALRADDFEVIITGDPVVTGATDCERTQITD